MNENINNPRPLQKGFIKMSDEEYEAYLAEQKRQEAIKNNPNSPENKYYVFLVVGGASDHMYFGATGRTEAYNTAKTLIEEDSEIDLNETIVLVEDNTLKNSISLYTFLKHMSENIFHDGLDIDSYIGNGSDEVDTIGLSSIPTGNQQVDVTMNESEGIDI